MSVPFQFSTGTHWGAAGDEKEFCDQVVVEGFESQNVGFVFYPQTCVTSQDHLFGIPLELVKNAFLGSFFRPIVRITEA